MDELISVNVIIGDRTYRLKVSSEDEEQLRNTVKIINKKIVEFKANFAGKDMQDYIAMVLLWFSTEQKINVQDEQLKTVSEKILSLKNLIEKEIEDKKQ
ncbi:MAG: cell division protein ZapA [Parafilimonas sp.]